MKTIKYEVKLERSVKIILGVLAVGILFHALQIIDKGLLRMYSILPLIY